MFATGALRVLIVMLFLCLAKGEALFNRTGYEECMAKTEALFLGLKVAFWKWYCCSDIQLMAEGPLLAKDAVDPLGSRPRTMERLADGAFGPVHVRQAPLVDEKASLAIVNTEACLLNNLQSRYVPRFICSFFHRGYNTGNIFELYPGRRLSGMSAEGRTPHWRPILRALAEIFTALHSNGLQLGLLDADTIVVTDKGHVTITNFAYVGPLQGRQDWKQLGRLLADMNIMNINNMKELTDGIASDWDHHKFSSWVEQHVR